MTTRQPVRPVPLSQTTPVNDDPAPGRAKQATFERGIALAYVVTAKIAISHLTDLTEGLRWIGNREAITEAIRMLDLLHADILRAEDQR